MDIESCGRIAIDSLIEPLQNLGSKCCSCDGADGIAGVICKSEFVLIGPGSKLEENVWGKKKGGIDSRIVNGCNIDKVINCSS